MKIHKNDKNEKLKKYKLNSEKNFSTFDFIKM